MKKSLTVKDLMCSHLGFSQLPSPERALQWFEVLEAGWVHNNDPAKPHVILASGKHSNGFFLCKKVLKYGNLREMLAACIINNLRKVGSLSGIGGVFGAPYSSITLSADVAKLMRVPHYIVEKSKNPDGSDGMVFKADDPIPDGTTLLQVEELITTLHSASLAKDAIITGNPGQVNFFPVIGALVYRPDNLENEFARYVCAHISKSVPSWEPDKCPLCAKGSVAIRPKGNWAQLVA